MTFPSAITQQPRINAALAEVVKEAAPSVVRIRYEIDHDWSGDWAIFFRILLSDEASQRQNLRDITGRVSEMISSRVDFSAMGILPYFTFRSQSEQAKLLEPAWCAALVE
jgi:hypothetical protein